MNRTLFLNGLIVAALGVVFSAASPSFAGENYNTTELNHPLLENWEPGCRPCAFQHYVKRRIAPGIWHHFIGAQTYFRCEGGKIRNLKRTVFGMSKAGKDEAVYGSIALHDFLEEKDGLEVKLIDGTCSTRAVDQIEKSVRITNRWRRKYDSVVWLSGRVIVTPIMGRPCAKAAKEIKKALFRN